MNDIKVSGHSMNCSSARQARRFFSDAELIQETGLNCKADVYVTQTFLEYGGEETCHRPHFVLIGRVSKVRGDFPGNISEVEFEENDRPEVRMEYHLSNEQIARMYEPDENGKSIFPDLNELKEFISYRDDKLGVRPETVFTSSIMNDNDYDDLPMDCSVLMIKSESENDVPIIFVQPENQFNIQLTEENSGYDLVKYMDNFVQEEVQIEDKSYMVVDDKVFEDTVEKEPLKPEYEKTEDEKVVDHIFGVTKPRVDEHVEKDKEEVALANEAAARIEAESEEEGYDSMYEKMMLDGEDETEPTSVEPVAKEEPVVGRPLTLTDIMKRNQKAQNLADKVEDKSDEDEDQTTKE